MSTSPKDDVWINTMRKELRKCKLEIITSQYSYIVFDEQTSGAALASIIRQENKVQGRLLSVTFKSNDLWEVHSVISIYAVTNPSSNKKYATSRNSRKAVNSKLTKALQDEIQYLQEAYGEAPITVIGDFQDTIHADQRDNIGIVGKKIHPEGPLQLLLNEGFISAFHKIHPNTQQVTRWNSSKSAGRHIDLHMLNASAASLLQNIIVDSAIAQNKITSDHLLICADYNFAKVEQDIIHNYRKRINFKKVSGIKMRCTKKLAKCPNTNQLNKEYTLCFDENQFMSCIAQNAKSTLDKWQEASETITMSDVLQSLESQMDDLELELLTEDSLLNQSHDGEKASVQRKLVERSTLRRQKLDNMHKKFHDAIIQVAASIKIITEENKHVDALRLRQKMKEDKIKNYGGLIFNLATPTSKIRSALGDLKDAEATLRNLNNNLFQNKAENSETNKENINNNTNNNANNNNNNVTAQNKQYQIASTFSEKYLKRCFSTLDKRSNSFSLLSEGISQLSAIHEENSANESAVSRHRHLDKFSGKWNECHFSADICQTLLDRTNHILQKNDVKQQVGMRQLDQSSIEDDNCSNLSHWWNGPELSQLQNASFSNIKNLDLHDTIKEALQNVRKLRRKSFNALILNKEKHIIHDARMNNTKNISLRLNPKSMDEPEAHHVILNPKSVHDKSDIRCNTFQECLDNTLLYHQNWMDKSGATWEHHWFNLTSKYGHVAGIQFRSSVTPNDSECKLLIKEYDKCSEKEKIAFQQAHSPDIFNMMRPLEHPHRALDWIWHPSSSNDEWDEFESNYWKAITSIPGKARHAGYNMAIIGRLPRRWINLHLRLMKMSMMLRILPQNTKLQTRVPIPKPKPGETRPLSLLHDDMCFLLGIITKHFTSRCEEIKLFPPSIRAYRQGMSTSFITLLDISAREDAITFGRMMGLTSEDEEKFFDRVSLEVQLAVLTILGFPAEGFLEMKAEEMDSISVEIHTRHGTIIGKFLHGLKQGSPLSCLLSNLVLIFKHRVWSLRDPLSTAEDPNGFSMTIWNKNIDGDSSPLISMEGFCDDNSKWNMGNGTDFATLVQAVRWNIKMAGDLSMIFKIGRKGDKTIIELFNVAWTDVHLLPKDGFTSIAWDFKANRPTEDEVDCRVYLKRGDHIPSSQPDTISNQVWNMLIKGTSLKSERSLGIWRNKLGDTTESAQKRASLLSYKIDRLNLSSLKNDKSIKIAINSLVVPVYQFGILENQCCPAVYDAMDIVLLNKVKKAIGFAWCDAKQLMFVSEANFGMGIRSVSGEMLKSICRELEVQLNDDDLVGKILRARLEAFNLHKSEVGLTGRMASHIENTNGIRNMIIDAIRHIATYGFYLRDMTDIETTYQIESAINLAQRGMLFSTFQNATLGADKFAGVGSRSGTTLGSGDSKLLWSSIYGRGHMLLKGYELQSNFKMNLSKDQFQLIASEAQTMIQDDIQALYTIFEWSGDPTVVPASYESSSPLTLAACIQSINKDSHWRRISAMSCMRASSLDENVHDNQDSTFLSSLLSSPREDLLLRIDTDYIHPNRLIRSRIEHLTQNGWPLIIATDGGADLTNSPKQGQHCASAGVAIFYPPTTPFERYLLASADEKSYIMNQNLLPWRARATPLPPYIGDHRTDNAHAECMAIIIMEEWIPINTPVLLIMDSEAERSRYQNLRQIDNVSNRFMIRSIMSGVSKCLGSRLARASAYHHSMQSDPAGIFRSNITDLCSHAKDWCYTSNGEQSLWKVDQWNPGGLRSVWAIRSHQLAESFIISPKNRYGSNLVPNRTFVSANQWADNVCNAITSFQRNATASKCNRSMRRWILPAASLGITGPNFIITLNGKCLDRNISVAVENACDLEFMRRLALRPTQGLVIRLKNSLLIKPEMLGRQSFLRRYIEGKTKTHTRSMYTDKDYLTGIVYLYAKKENREKDKEHFKANLKIASKLYKFLRCPCCLQLDAFCSTELYHDSIESNSNAKYSILSRDRTENNSGLYGNSRHYLFYCLQQHVADVRTSMTQFLEDQLTSLLKMATYWGKFGFPTLLRRSNNALIELDRSPFHNAHLKNKHYSKTDQSKYASISPDDWVLLIESQAAHLSLAAQNAFLQWPLVHQFGFIPANAYTQLELEDGEYSPCDLIPLGIIPISLQLVIETFAAEIGHRNHIDRKNEFLRQWKSIRATSLLRAISIAMAAGARTAILKDNMIRSLPPQLFESKLAGPEQHTGRPQSNSINASQPNPHDTQDDHCIKQASSLRHQSNKKTKITQSLDATDSFPCMGITCSIVFSSKTNLRPSHMPKINAICRRCINMTRAISIAQDIETALSINFDQFQILFKAICSRKNLSFDYLIATIAQLKPLPASILPTYFHRSTKRNVFPIAMTNAMRMLCGTFNWKCSEKPTSLDIVFNQAKPSTPSRKRNEDKSSLAKHTMKCNCSIESIFFNVDAAMRCPSCNNTSSFSSTATRISLASHSTELQTSYGLQVVLPETNNNRQPQNSPVKFPNNNKYASSIKQSITALNDITNTPRLPPPICLAARPADAELNAITRTNNMLSNFVVSYFFKILQSSFSNILYQEFLFDFVKREGGWKEFVQYSRREGHSTDFLEKLKNNRLICIVPICHDIHWTLIIRKFVENVWEIYYIDSILQGSDERMRQWQTLFQDDDLFSGNWIKFKIIPQTELECGARVCLHGLCFALSLLNKRDIGRQLERIKDLAVRSRLLVSRICTDGQWSNPGWLKSIIGTPTSTNQAGATATTN
jgi:hypothetical protein